MRFLQYIPMHAHLLNYDTLQATIGLSLTAFYNDAKIAKAEVEVEQEAHKLASVFIDVLGLKETICVKDTSF